ncbi:formate--tetrahydrofolate ligase [Roseospira marina]|uniref:Formate--tetrahydrofolate ligase n=1 Tax=Roseospira marina TaxID=140057 RepID=A0A5M6IG29_9PROT|nr:formate--tetrahydrofolate ligase [Roseospira marina]KAA5607260.1 formate--tetrahydrofolate ligase [Roseospira marina]MBB4312588.1 formate--tetrahydrofolate ligase [Roseospira marina]MBB5085396.1 formate--tetrahydrofolate ligase [Roseospira marina]
MSQHRSTVRPASFDLESGTASCGASCASAGDGLPPPGTPDIEIARAARPRAILDLAADTLDIPSESLIPYGHTKAKITLDYIAGLRTRPRGQLVLVTAITPTPAGEGKTTTSVGLNDGLNRIGLNSAVCLREPSLGPCFGMKGGAAGGGRAQVIPMEDINLHFTGDFHAITAAHNLLAALIDNHLHWGNAQHLDVRRVSWRRVMDVNDRALRNITLGLGGPAHGIPREGGFDITVASEVMAVLCLATDLSDLQERLGGIVIGLRSDKSPVFARDIGADGAMTVLLRDALAPNLVQTLEHNPAFIHGGPFANIAHGCNSVMATDTALRLNDVVVTEAGFGADLGAEKFLHIKCRQSGLRPHAVVVVATVRALKMHGGVAKGDLGIPDPDAVRRGTSNLQRHVTNLQAFGLAPIVAINQFSGDTRAELDAVRAACDAVGVPVALASHWADGSRGSENLARLVAERLDAPPPEVRFLYPDSMPLPDKIRTVAQRVYGAADITLDWLAQRGLEDIAAQGYGHLPICIAKTQYSFSADPGVKGAPEGHVLPIREVRLAAGAGFVVAICGDIMTMPGLPQSPAALHIGLGPGGEVVGLT